jgi:cytochrome P450
MTLAMPKRRNNDFLLGDLKDFQTQPLPMLLDIAPSYGPVTLTRFVNVPQVVVTDPEGALHVLQKNSRNYMKQQDFMAVARQVLLSGDDLFTSDGDPWLKRRRLMQPAFHRKVISRFSDLIIDAVTRRMAQWADDTPLDMEQEMMDVTMSIIGQAMLSRNILDDHPQLYHAFETVSGFVIDKATNPADRFTPNFVPTARNRAFHAALDVIRTTLKEVIDERRVLADEDQPHDLLTLLLAGRDDESNFVLQPDQLMDELFGIVTAGHETTSVTLSWLFYELADHPDLVARLRHELDRVLAGRMPTPDDLPNLPLLAAAVNEALRRYPAAYVTTRQSIGADEIGGYAIDAKRTVLINIYGLHHHADLWRDPMAFDPDRWGRDEITPGAFLAFGDGPRKCIGEPLARLEMALITALVVQRFDLRRDPRPSTLQARFTLRSQDGVWLRPLPIDD